MNDFAKLGLAINVSSAERMPLIARGEDEARKDENGVAAYIEYLSEDSEPGRKFARDTQRDTIRKIRRGGAKVIDETDDLESHIAKLCVLGTGWHLVSAEGAFVDIPFSPANLRTFLEMPGHFWAVRDSAIFVGTAANFTKASSAS